MTILNAQPLAVCAQWNPLTPRRTYWFSTYAPAEDGGGYDTPRRFAPGGASASGKKRACAPLRDAKIGTRF